jgi:hypothetical protein
MKPATIAIVCALAALLIFRLPIFAQSASTNPEMGGDQPPPANDPNQPGADAQEPSDDGTQAANPDADMNSDDSDQSDQGDADSNGDQGGDANTESQ